MKKLSKISLCALMCALVLSGCTAADESENTKTNEDSQSQPEENENPQAQTEESENSQIKPNEDEKTEAQDKEEKNPNELSEEEKSFFTDFINSIENNGFLQSEYAAATDADLNEVFYNGVGVSTHSLSEEEEAAYEEATGWGIYTDVERLTTKEIDDFLINRTGYSLAEMNSVLNWVYLEQFDVYISEHGDTNWLEYNCTGGRKDGDIYEIYYGVAYSQENDDIGVLTLKKSGDDYIIVSNKWNYTPDLSGLSDEEIKQLEIFAEAKDIWNMEDYEPLNICYTVYDLDKDGKLELITSATAGTGLYSENHFYNTDDTFTELKELPQEYSDEYSEFDINFNDGEAYSDGDTLYYAASDVSKNGVTEYYEYDGAYYIKDGVVHSVVYRGTYTLWHDEDTSEQTWYDAAGNEITEDEWNKLYDEFYEGMEHENCQMVWLSITPSELKTASVERILCALADAAHIG